MGKLTISMAIFNSKLLVYQRLVPPNHRNDILLVSVDRNARNAPRPVASPSAWEFFCGLDLALDLAPRRASAAVWPTGPRKSARSVGSWGGNEGNYGFFQPGSPKYLEIQCKYQTSHCFSSCECRILVLLPQKRRAFWKPRVDKPKPDWLYIDCSSSGTYNWYRMMPEATNEAVTCPNKAQ